MPTQAYGRTKDGSKITKIVVDRDSCIGAAPCTSVAPETFELDMENKAVVTNANAIDDDTLIAAAQSCPTQAISLYDDAGNQIYP